jgi:hypothetical protein
VGFINDHGKAFVAQVGNAINNKGELLNCGNDQAFALL